MMRLVKSGCFLLALAAVLMTGCGQSIGANSAVLPADKAVLLEKITEAQELYDSLVISADGKDIDKYQYWVSSRAVLEFAIETAQNIYDKPIASQWEIDTALQGLIEAYNRIDEDKKPGLFEADKSVLKGAIAAARGKMADVVIADDGAGLLNSEYWVSEALFTALEAAIAAAEAIDASDNPTQAEADAAAAALEAAIAAFVPHKGLLTPGSISYTFSGPQDETITLSGAQALNWVENDVLQVRVMETYDSYQWYVDGLLRAGETGTSITLYAQDFSVNTHTVALRVTRSSIPYSKTLTFTVK